MFIVIAAFILAIPMVGWTSYMTNRNGDIEERKKHRKVLTILPKILLIWGLIILVFIQWFLTQWTLWDYTLIIAISELSIISILASEHKFWKLLRIER